MLLVQSAFAVEPFIAEDSSGVLTRAQAANGFW
jgi:hypothetical protein